MDEFWTKVERTESCWIWQGAMWRNGYGRFKDGPMMYAHRASYIITHGGIPYGLQILHRCDNRACVNPDHLFLGTQRDNMRDMVAKGRQGDKARQGTANGRSKLSPEDVAEIRKKHASGVSISAIAREYGVSRPNIRFIVTRVTWKEPR